jgi:hypothetical protein
VIWFDPVNEFGELGFGCCHRIKSQRSTFGEMPAGNRYCGQESRPLYQSDPRHATIFKQFV